VTLKKEDRKKRGEKRTLAGKCRIESAGPKPIIRSATTD